MFRHVVHLPLSEFFARCSFEGVNSVVGIIPLPMRLGVLKRHLWLPDTGKKRHSRGPFGELLIAGGDSPPPLPTLPQGRSLAV
jgi:hypothetical protein